MASFGESLIETLNKNLRIQILLLISLIDSLLILTGFSLALRVTTIDKQHIKDITFMQIYWLHCGQIFVHVGGISPLRCDHFVVVTQKK